MANTITARGRSAREILTWEADRELLHDRGGEAPSKAPKAVREAADIIYQRRRRREGLLVSRQAREAEPGRVLRRYWQKKLNNSAELRSWLRWEADLVWSTHPIGVGPGGDAPRLTGHGCYFRWTKWPGGYVPSTHLITVGVEWLVENAPRPKLAKRLVKGPRETRRAMDAVGPEEHADWYREDNRLRRAAEKLNVLSQAPDPDRAEGVMIQAKRLFADVANPDTWYITEENIRGRAVDAVNMMDFAHALAAWAEHRQSQPTDDARRIDRPYLLASGREGLLIGIRKIGPTVVQVVVRDSTTGFRHAITVPSIFGAIGSGHWKRLENDDARVHAAIAWTFRLDPENYRPAVEA